MDTVQCGTGVKPVKRHVPDQIVRACKSKKLNKRLRFGRTLCAAPTNVRRYQYGENPEGFGFSIVFKDQNDLKGYVKIMKFVGRSWDEVFSLFKTLVEDIEENHGMKFQMGDLEWSQSSQRPISGVYFAQMGKMLQKNWGSGILYAVDGGGDIVAISRYSVSCSLPAAHAGKVFEQHPAVSIKPRRRSRQKSLR